MVWAVAHLPSAKWGIVVAETARGARQVVVDRQRLPVWKRAIDVAASLTVMVVGLPVAAVTAVAIAVTMGRPVLFRQQRGGWGGEEFSILKFRTMTDERGPDGELLADQERRHPLGNLLRSTSIDELPALINILRGEMSLVGPRPLMAKYLDRYDSHQIQRHRVHPGLTGFAQVSGRNALDWDEKFELDLEYVARRSLAFDIQIVLRTVRNIVRPEGVDGIDFTTEFMGTWGDSPEAEQQEACSTEVGSPEILITGGKEL